MMREGLKVEAGVVWRRWRSDGVCVLFGQGGLRFLLGFEPKRSTKKTKKKWEKTEVVRTVRVGDDVYVDDLIAAAGPAGPH